MMPYYGYTFATHKPLLPQLRAAVQAYADRHGQLPSAIYLRQAAVPALVYPGGTIPVEPTPAIAPDVIGLAVPTLNPAPVAVRYAQEVLL
jgi:hypothetical protein